MKFFRNYFLLIAFCTSANLNAQVVINEYSCSNFSLNTDNYGEQEDWIELYNPGPAPANIGGYFLSDRSNQPDKWRIPAGTIMNGNGYLKIWASGRNESTAGILHTNFRISQTKLPTEEIVFSDPASVVIDRIDILPAQKNHSRGRNIDGGSSWGILLVPTPGLSNTGGNFRPRYSERPSFNISPGFFNSSINVTITSPEPNSVIHYTLNGTEPTGISPVYSLPLRIDSTTVLKAAAFAPDPGIPPSFVCFGTYFIDDFHTIPVVSVGAEFITDLANGDGNLLPEGSIEYFNINRQRRTAGYGEFNRHGQDSWANDQRSIDFIMRDEMGYNYALQEQLFSLTRRDEFQRVILRAAGDDNYPAAHHTQNEGSAHVRDAYVQNLAKSGNMNVDVRTGTKAIVYLNGEYWGVYDLRELPDDHDYTDYYYGQGKYELQYIETWGGTWAEYGGQQALTDWSNFHDYVMASNMNDPAVWDNVTRQLDVASLVDYVMVNSFTVCSDWLNYNTGWWRGLDSSGTHKKWGYILWDNDAVFGFYTNYTGIPDKSANAKPCDVEANLSDPENHIELLNKLRTNVSFNRYYISRYADLLNTTFSCDNMLRTLDSISNVIDPEMDRHAQRWFGTYAEWRTNLQQLRDYISQRCTVLPSLMDTCYNLTGPYPLYVTTDLVGGGKVQINSLVLSDFPWTGYYYGNLPVQLTAHPDVMNGISFDSWETHFAQPQPSAFVLSPAINISATDTVIAHFLSHIITNVNEIPEDVHARVYPSVVSEKTTVEFFNKEPQSVNISLTSALGQSIIYIKGENSPAGSNQFTLDLSDKKINPGIYLLNFKSKNFNSTVKIIYTGN